MKKEIWLILGAIAIVGVIAAAALLRGGISGPSTAPLAPAGEAVFETQSNPISEEDIPEQSIQIKMDKYSASPSEFRAKTGTMITIAVTSVDNFSHVFKFRDPPLKNVAIAVGPNETRAMSFTVPAPGEYEFYSDVPFQTVKGKMIVVR